MSVTDFVFGDLRFDAGPALLYRGSGIVPLGGRATALLQLLLSRRGDVITKDELIDAAWPRLAVEESNLSVQIAKLRKALGRSPGGSEWIVTVQRTGYRFLPETAAPQDTAARIGPPAIAVLRFADFAGQAGTPLGDYLAQDVITALSRFRSLAVSARSTSFQFDSRTIDSREVAKRLGTAYVAEGSFRRIGDRLRLSLQLIDGATGATLWADNLHQPLTHGVGDTDELAGRAAAAIEAQVHLAEIGRAHRERPDSMAAYDYYLRARRRIQTSTQADNAIALDLYFRAIELDRENIEFLAGAAEAIHHRRSVGWPDVPGSSRRVARELSQRGMDRAGGDAASLGLFGNAMLTSNEEDIGYMLTTRAEQVNGNSALALVCNGLALIWSGELDEAEIRFRRAAELSAGEPTERFAIQGMGKIAAARQDWESAIAWGHATCALSPGLTGGHLNRIAGSAMMGRLKDAQHYLAEYVRIAPGVTIRSLDAGQPFRHRAHVEPLLEGLRRAGLPER